MGSAGQNDFHDTALAKGPGIVIGRSGASFGQVHFAKEDFWPHNTGLYVTDFKGNDPLFAFYFLKALDFDRFNSGSAQPSLNRNFIYPIPIRVPKPAEQKAIATVLGALDDKIELNRRMNATLAAMARALFQSWFIDFDPVRANLDRNQPSPAASRHPLPVGEGRGEGSFALDPATAALFPEHLEDSPLGHIPKRWTTGKLGDWDDSADVASGKSAFKKGEILFRKLRPYFHKVGVAPFNGVCSTDILALAPKSPEWFGFLLGHASSDELIQFTDLASNGAKMPRTNWSDISSFKVALPPKPIAAAFTRNIQPMLDRIHANIHQSRTLAALRDTLLPKLLSGELSVGDGIYSKSSNNSKPTETNP